MSPLDPSEQLEEPEIPEVPKAPEVPEPSEMPEVDPPAPDPLPEDPGTVSPDDWQLLLVNRWNPIPDGYTFELTQLKQGHAVDARAYPDLQEMMDACRAAGLDPKICSSYRTQDKQQELYENKIQRLMDEGYSYERAVEEAGTVVAVPGTSEHQTGLALDIVDASYQILDEEQENTQVQQWLMEHSWEYGFVLRYPNGKSETTGIIYEPWHYRYVGREAAREMTELGLCLEEYVAWLSAQ
ncbi:MAG TPA: D-alanyl-D-alanine carboxypeptidase family protein [Candidatus Oscillibacter excrementigallinarum]|uniref:D-alanyl-D-alanine carboxypeptidase family protein n=1 Tax=Candidatus Oscillibacter excrementigallinarum TaxID=2838716 RepID=A0A9D2LJR8_9FIRM|nr:D-alanyl-D-alanine carboxypeptidase family protein [Candidatus Oscillibacter excrementigallinarum]